MVSDEMYSLDNLQDIVIPDAPPLWPPAPAVLVILGIATAALMVAGWQLIASWRHNAYRRAGLTLLREARTGHEVSVVLKRVALAVFPRGQVAALYGTTWLAFLNRTCACTRFSDSAVLQTDSQAHPELIASAGIWIRRHRLPDNPHSNGGN
jgi:hypothetical protein